MVYEWAAFRLRFGLHDTGSRQGREVPAHRPALKSGILVVAEELVHRQLAAGFD
jgi:hypothetical protein